ncbi:MAG TPA: nicotinate-nucleotide--dimethylbenzimidazole phosphoribosyltransferase [Solirubrobacteraceae bacterium]|nr:nicotinate-nucleotide--dimethylbenzimidazole phosphoribosyltransferase [Solirubrobacteraceae bacterium]
MTLEDRVLELAAEVGAPDDGCAAAARARHRYLVKPAGSLGRLEELGARLAAVAGTCPPPVCERPAAVVAAGDHGVLVQGVSAWPAEVTPAMVGEFCSGRAAVNALADCVGAQVSVLDVGVAVDLPRHPRLRTAKVQPGTADLSRTAAMDREAAARAVLAGAGIAEELTGAGVDLLVTGDMGIGNTTPAACLVAAFTGAPAERATGPGAGLDDGTLARKAQVVRRALERHRPAPADPLGALAAVGGLEHAALVGLVLGGARGRLPVVLDGVSTVAAGLVACALRPAVRGYLIAGHRSTEPGASLGLEHLGLEPLLDLGMRLGEATGGLLAVPLVRAAAAALSRMATFEEAGIPA